MDARESAFRKAAMLLSTIGAEYAIVYSGKLHTSGDCKFAMETKDGTLHSNKLEIAKRKVSTKVNDFSGTGYVEALKHIEPGESWEYICKNKVEAIALQRAVCGSATRLWGPSSYISTVKDSKVFEILRLETTL